MDIAQLPPWIRASLKVSSAKLGVYPFDCQSFRVKTKDFSNKTSFWWQSRLPSRIDYIRQVVVLIFRDFWSNALKGISLNTIIFAFLASLTPMSSSITTDSVSTSKKVAESTISSFIPVLGSASSKLPPNLYYYWYRLCDPFALHLCNCFDGNLHSEKERRWKVKFIMV